jgi:hypothetical protein
MALAQQEPRKGLVAEVGASRWRRKARNLGQVGSLGETGKPVSATLDAEGQRRERLDVLFLKITSGRGCEGISTARRKRTWRRRNPRGDRAAAKANYWRIGNGLSHG